MGGRVPGCQSLFLQFAAILALALATSVTTRTQDAAEKSIFVSVVDASAKPVTDLTAAEFRIQEDNAMREITGVKPATQPLFIELLADTTRNAGASGLIRDIRQGLTAFVRQIAAASPEAQIAIMEFGQAAITVTNFTSKTADLEKGITRLFPKPDAASVLLEAFIEATKNLAKKPGPRKAIVVVNVEPGDEQSREQPNRIGEAFRSCRASLWTISLRRDEQLNPTRDVVLNMLTPLTGGRREFVVAPAGLETWLRNYADTLISQYEVTYKRPTPSGPTQQTRVDVTRPRLRVMASSFPPQ